MKMLKIFIFTLVLLALFWNCDSPTDNKDKIAVLSGQVLDVGTLNPIANAGLIVLDFPEVSGLTNNEGFFTIEVETEVSLEIQLRVFKDGYYADTLALLAVPGNTLSNITVSLESRTAVSQPSGSAASVILFSANPSSIGVRKAVLPKFLKLLFRFRILQGSRLI